MAFEQFVADLRTFFREMLIELRDALVDTRGGITRAAFEVCDGLGAFRRFLRIRLRQFLDFADETLLQCLVLGRGVFHGRIHAPLERGLECFETLLIFGHLGAEQDVTDLADVSLIAVFGFRFCLSRFSVPGNRFCHGLSPLSIRTLREREHSKKCACIL